MISFKIVCRWLKTQLFCLVYFIKLRFYLVQCSFLIKISLVKTPQLIKIYYLFRDESKAATMIRLIKKDILTESSMDEGGNHIYHLFFIWIGVKKAPFPFCFDHWFPFKSFCIHLFPCMYYFADDVVSPNTWHYFCCRHNPKNNC